MCESVWSAHFNKELSTGLASVLSSSCTPPPFFCSCRARTKGETRFTEPIIYQCANCFDSCVTITWRAVVAFVKTCKSARWSCFSQSRNPTGTVNLGVKTRRAAIFQNVASLCTFISTLRIIEQNTHKNRL